MPIRTLAYSKDGGENFVKSFTSHSPLGLTKSARVLRCESGGSLSSTFRQVLGELLGEWHSKLGFGACWDRIDSQNGQYLQYDLSAEQGEERRCVILVPTNHSTDGLGFMLEVRTLGGFTEARISFRSGSPMICHRELFISPGSPSPRSQPRFPETHIEGFDIKVVVTVIGLMGLIMRARMLTARKMEMMTRERNCLRERSREASGSNHKLRERVALMKQRMARETGRYCPQTPVSKGKFGEGSTVFLGHVGVFRNIMQRLGTWTYASAKKHLENLNNFSDRFIDPSAFSPHRLDTSGFILNTDSSLQERPEESGKCKLEFNSWNLLSLVVKGSQMEHYIRSNMKKIIPLDFQCSTQVSVPKDNYYASIELKVGDLCAHLSFAEVQAFDGGRSMFISISRKDEKFPEVALLALVFLVMSLHATDSNYSYFELPSVIIKHLQEITQREALCVTDPTVILSTLEVERFCKVAATVWKNAVDSLRDEQSK